MKKIMSFFSILLIVFSCKKDNKSNFFFASDKLYYAIINGVDKLQSSEYYYIFAFSDSLVVTSVSNLNGCLSCGGAKKIGSFNYDNKLIIVTKPIDVKYNFVNNLPSKRLKPISTTQKINRNPEGIIYKLKDSNTFREVYKGDVSNFINKYEYQLHPKD